MNGDLHLTIPAEFSGARLDKALAALAPELTRARIQSLLREGAVTGRDGITLREGKIKVKPGAEYIIRVPEPEPMTLAAQAIPLHILYEDEHLLVLDKPAGLVVHPAAGNPDKTLVNALLAHCGESLAGIGGVARPGIVHRLDKDTSGVMVAAKTDAAHQGLTALFAEHDIERVYLAAVRGVPAPSSGIVETAIGRHPVHRKKMAVVDETRGKRAITRYKVLKAFGKKASLVECRLETGRTHQVRVHMAHLRHPLIGDALYARPSRELPPFPRQALHAAVLGFRHPVTGKNMCFESPPPEDFKKLIASLESPA